MLWLNFYGDPGILQADQGATQSSSPLMKWKSLQKYKLNNIYKITFRHILSTAHLDFIVDVY